MLHTESAYTQGLSTPVAGQLPSIQTWDRSSLFAGTNLKLPAPHEYVTQLVKVVVVSMLLAKVMSVAAAT